MSDIVVADTHLAVSTVWMLIAVRAVLDSPLTPPVKSFVAIQNLGQRGVPYISEFQGKSATGLDVTLWCYAKGVEPSIAHEFIVVPLCLLHSITTNIIRQVLVTEDNFKFLMSQSEIGGCTLVAIHRIGDVQVELRKGTISVSDILDGVIGSHIRLHDAALQQHGKRILAAFTDKGHSIVVRADNTGYGVVNFRHVAI